MEKLLNENGEYFYSEFYGLNDVVFRIIGTKCAINAKSCLSCTDTFKSINTGTVIEIKRQEVLDKVRLGKMKPVIASKINHLAPQVARIKTTKKK